MARSRVHHPPNFKFATKPLHRLRGRLPILPSFILPHCLTLIMPSKKKAGSKTAAAPTQPIEISEEEQWRLINESGILNQVPQGISPSTLYPPSEAQVAAQSPPESSFCDEIFNAALLVIPFSSMFLLMEM